MADSDSSRGGDYDDEQEQDFPTDPEGIFEALVEHGVPPSSLQLVFAQLGTWHCANCTRLNHLEDELCQECDYPPREGPFDRLKDQPTPSAARAPRRRGTGYVYEPRTLLHNDRHRVNIFDLHVERPDRVRAIMARLCESGVAARMTRIPARLLSREEARSVHDDAYLAELEHEWADAPHSRGDTYVAGGDSRVAAHLAAGGVVEAVEKVMRGEIRNAIAVVRPPGHHAEPDACMGFCFLNNVAIAAQQARLRMGAQRVLILDWDVHHGNGTQHFFEDDDSVLFASLHRFDNGTFYPGTGAAHEIGRGRGTGFNINVPWPHGVGDTEYVAAFHHLLLPVFSSFRPDLVIVSAGFDSARGDPLGGCHVSPAGFAFMAASLSQLAGGRMVVALEGGYNLQSISVSAEAVVHALLGDPLPQLRLSAAPAAGAMHAIAQARSYLEPHWGVLALPRLPPVITAPLPPSNPAPATTPTPEQPPPDSPGLPPVLPPVLPDMDAVALAGPPPPIPAAAAAPAAPDPTSFAAAQARAAAALAAREAVAKAAAQAPAAAAAGRQPPSSPARPSLSRDAARAPAPALPRPAPVAFGPPPMPPPMPPPLPTKPLSGRRRSVARRKRSHSLGAARGKPPSGSPESAAGDLHGGRRYRVRWAGDRHSIGTRWFAASGSSRGGKRARR